MWRLRAESCGRRASGCFPRSRIVKRMQGCKGKFAEGAFSHVNQGYSVFCTSWCERPCNDRLDCLRTIERVDLMEEKS